MGEIEAAIIATPTTHHHAIGMELLGCGVPLLVEKPLALTSAQANDLRVLFVRLGKKISIGVYEVCDLHPVAVCVFTRAKNVPIEIYGFFRKRKNGSDFDPVAILNGELVHGSNNARLIVGFGHVYAQHGPVFVRLNAIDIDMPQRAGG